MVPRLVVFDFHGTLSLHQGSSGIHDFIKNSDLMRINDLKTFLRNFKMKNEPLNWYQLMIRSQIEPKLMVPQLDDLIQFTNFIQQTYPNTVLSVASMLESSSFIHAMMKYVFEKRGLSSPFPENLLIGNDKLCQDLINFPGKLWHIETIQKILGQHFLPEEILVVDDDSDTIHRVQKKGMKGILVQKYFTLQDGIQYF